MVRQDKPVKGSLLPTRAMDDLHVQVCDIASNLKARETTTNTLLGGAVLGQIPGGCLQELANLPYTDGASVLDSNQCPISRTLELSNNVRYA